ncbi:MAG: radical SAM protein [Nitrospirota bacterium]
MKINELFYSIQGESTHAGRPCVFIRAAGCHLRCEWCDTAYAFYEGEEMTLDEIMARVRGYGCPLVELTGGEPLLQREAPALAARLLNEGYTVLVETSGSLDIRLLDPRAIVVMDVKCPGSGMTRAMRWDNLEALKPTDEVKFVIKDRADYEWAAALVARHHLDRRCPVLFSPVFGALEPQTLAGWLLADRLPVRLQLQQHKYIWEPETRGV